MSVDDVLDGQTLILGAPNQTLGIIRWVNECGNSCFPVTDQIPEVSVATSANLLEDEIH